jgi:TPR repeat protein
MGRFWKIATLVACVTVICGAAIVRLEYKKRATDRKLAEAARACRVRAEQGDAGAEFKLGRMYYYGTGVPRDYTEAARWYSKAADQGDAEAQYAVGYIYYCGQGVPQSYAEALRWGRKAADQGYARAEDGLAAMYYYGRGVPQDYAESARWYRKAADQGDAWGQADLGFAYEQGKGVPQDYAEAVRWYRRAGDQGDAAAQYYLGGMYYNGKGVPRDNAEAMRWYRKSAGQGYARAQYALGVRRRPGTLSKINLSIAFVGGVFLLFSSRGSIRNREQRATTLTALLVLLWAGLDLYWFYPVSILHSVSALRVFRFTQDLLSGICVAMLIFIVWSQSSKTVLRISGILLVGFNIYAIAHHSLESLGPSMRLFYLANGLLIGMSVPPAITLWLPGKRTQTRTEPQ